MQLQYMAAWVPPFVAAMETERAAKDLAPFTTFQLATVNREGFPHNRTLVLRGFLFGNKANNVLTFCTDRRAEKYQELLHNDRFEAVFYFERARKQFRLRGRARIVDTDHVPSLDLATIQPKHILESLLNSSDSDSDSDGDSDRDEPAPRGAKQASTTTKGAEPTEAAEATKPSTTSKTEPTACLLLQALLPFPLLSPLQQHLVHSDAGLYTNLHDLVHVEFHPPTASEWQAEVRRVWDDLLGQLQLLFRGPTPRLPLDTEKQNLIDKIARGVDGQGEDSGLRNFAVVAMFVDYVDLYDSEKVRRYLYRKDDGHHWEEQEVCP